MWQPLGLCGCRLEPSVEVGQPLPSLRQGSQLWGVLEACLRSMRSILGWKREFSLRTTGQVLGDEAFTAQKPLSSRNAASSFGVRQV